MRKPKKNNLLKLNWERRHEHFHIDIETAKALITPLENSKIKAFLLLSDGCANSNYKIQLENGKTYILRIYIRECNAFYRETQLHTLLRGKVSIPDIVYTNDDCDTIQYPFTIMEFVEGDLMREVLLQGNHNDIEDCAFSAGYYLNRLRQIVFSQSGFFDKSLDVTPFSEEEDYLKFTQSCLQSESVNSAIGNDLSKQLTAFTTENSRYFPKQGRANLTHADFDASNLLVKKCKGHYKISAILDWEFAFAGTYLFDVGLFLRYSHKLPTSYEESFIEGLLSDGGSLPKNWKKSSKLLDILSLLSILNSDTSIDRTNLKQDIISLLKNTMARWDQY